MKIGDWLFLDFRRLQRLALLLVMVVPKAERWVGGPEPAASQARRKSRARPPSNGITKGTERRRAPSRRLAQEADGILVTGKACNCHAT